MTAVADDHISDRAYQVRAVRALVAGLVDGGRGQLRSACGTGKTKIALWTAERVSDHGGVVVIVCPTVGLVDQTLRVWAQAHGDHHALAVCSDESVNADSTSHVEDILEPVTTDPDVVAAWLRQPARMAIRLIVGTHVSAHVVGEGLYKARQIADLLVIDEAHRTAGRVDKHAALVHDDEVLPARRRLYMTGTPQIFIGSRHQRDGELAAYSMDDEATFGPVLVNYPFSEAIDDGWLDDYRVAVIGVTRHEVLGLLRSIADTATPHRPLPSQHAAMVQAAIARAAAQFGLRRVIAFTPRVRDAMEFARTFPQTLTALPAALRPTRPLSAEYVHGGMDTAQRHEVITRLANPPHDGWAIVANAKCLSEGIDVPAVDCIAFTAPKRSPTDIVQAIGRALRRDPTGSGTATILVPILLPDSPDEVDEHVDAGAYDVLWEVARALRAHDDVFGAALDEARASHFQDTNRLNKLSFTMPPSHADDSFLEHLTVRLVKAATSKWWDGYAYLVDFHTREGHSWVQKNYVTADGFALGTWTSSTRSAFKQKRLSPDRVEVLEKLDFVFDARAAQWESNLAALRRFHAEFGNLDIPKDLTSDTGVQLQPALSIYRGQHRRGVLAPERVAALNELGLEWETGSTGSWLRMITTLRAYHAEHGDILVPPDYCNDKGVNVADWLRIQRTKGASGDLSPEHVRELDSLGMVWEKGRSQWERILKRLRAYHNEHGTINISYKESQAGGEAAALRDLIVQYRATRRRGTLPDYKEEDLTGLGLDWDPVDGHDQRWYANYNLAAAFCHTEGHLEVPTGHTAAGLRLDHWVREQRATQSRGELAADRVAALDAIGMVWKPKDQSEAAWDRAIALLAEYRDTVGPLAEMRSTYQTGCGFWLGSWITRQRRQHTDGTIATERAAQLTTVGVNLDPRPKPPPRPTTRRRVDTWPQDLPVLRAYHATHGDINISRETDLTVGRIVHRLRAAHRAGKLAADRVQTLDKLGIIWAPRQTALQNGIAAARRFHASTGHLRPPYGYTDSENGIDLYAWVGRMRGARVAGGLTDAQIEELDAIGMVWDLQQATWDEGHAAAAAFHAAYGHLRVPGDYRGVGLDGEPHDLLAFLNRQRGYQRRGELGQDRVSALDAFGFDWEPQQSRWEANLASLRTHYRQHGHLIMPASHVVDGIDIGNVISRARRDYADGTLPAERIAAFEEMGIVWSPQDTAWAQMIDFLQSYHREHGHIQAPKGTRTPRGMINARSTIATNGVDVCEWLNRQRDRRTAGDLTDAQVAELDKLDMVWEKNANKKSQWDASYAIAQRFYDEHRHLTVPVTNPRNSNEINTLYDWVCRQRTAYSDGSLTDDRIAALEKIGMAWDPTPAWDRSWMQLYEQVKTFGAKFGHFRFRTVGPDDPQLVKLDKWLHHQRSLHDKGELRDDRFALLDAIGVDWRPRAEQAWDEAIERLRTYRKTVGDPNNMTGHYVGPDGFHLYDWFRRSRNAAENGELPVAWVHDLLESGVRLDPQRRQRRPRR